MQSQLDYIAGDLDASKLAVLRCLELLGDIELRGPVLDRLGGILVRHALDDRDLDAAAWWLALMDDHTNESLVVRELLPMALGARLAQEQRRWVEAERLARQVIEATERAEIRSVAPAGEARVTLAEILLEQGRLGEAEDQAPRAAEDLGERRLTIGEARARLVAVGVATARFGPAGGRRLLEATRRRFDGRHLGVDVRWWLDAAECRLALLDGDVREGERLLGSVPASNVRCLLRARLALVCGRRDQVSLALDDLVDASEPEQVEALLLAAQAEPRAAAIASVRRAAAIAVDAGLCQTFVREGSDVLRLARAALHDGPDPALSSLLDRVVAPRAPARGDAFFEPLADRELDLLRQLPSHLTYHEIADQMLVSVNTVKTYQKALFRKLGATKRSEAVAIARRAGLLEPAGRPAGDDAR